MKLTMKLLEFASVLALSGLPRGQRSTGSAARGSSVLSPALEGASLAPDAVVLTVGDQKMTRAQFESAVCRRWRKTDAPANTAAAKRQVAEQFGEIGNHGSGSAQAQAGSEPEVKQMMMVQADNFLAHSLAKKLSDGSEASPTLDLQSYYDTHKDEFEEATGQPHPDPLQRARPCR